MGAVASLLQREPEGRNMNDLPVEVIFSILTWLPASFLQNHGKFVCKTWADIIRDPEFLKCHALVQVAKINQAKIEAAELEYMLKDKEILARSSGVILVQSNSDKKHLSVVKPATRKFIDLPRLPYKMLRACVGYVPSTGEIKVICHVHQTLCVLTVGFNMAWRLIDVDPNVPLSYYTCEALFVAMDGVLFHWYVCYPQQKMKLYAINLADESTHHVEFPGPWFFRVVSTGKSIYVPQDEFCSFAPVTAAWKLKDFSTSEWEVCEIVGLGNRPLLRSKFYDFSEHKNTTVSS